MSQTPPLQSSEPFARPDRLLLVACAGLALGAASCGAGRGKTAAAAPPAAPTIAASDQQRPATAPSYSTPLERSALRERSLEVLKAGTTSREALVRANALEGMQSAPSRAEPLVRAGLVDENPGVRFVAVMTVAQLRLKDSAPFIEPLLQDRDPRVQAAAVLALTRTGHHPDPTVLANTLQNPDSRMRSEAARVLGEMGNPSAMPMLRAAAAASIYSTANPASSSGEAAAIDGPRYQLERAFQLQVAEALARLGDAEAGDSLRAALYPPSKEGFESAVLAAQILGGLKDPKAIAQLVDLVEQTAPNSAKGPDPRAWTFLQPKELRLAAATALAKMGYPGGVYVGEMYANDPDPIIRAQAALVFGFAGQPRTLGAIAKLMEDPSEVVRVAAAAAALRILEKSPG